MIIEYIISKQTDIKTALEEKELSKTLITSLLSEKKDIFINGKAYQNDYNLKEGDRLKIIINDKPSSLIPVEKDIEIIYEDDLFLIVNKEKGLSTIPSKLHFADNLAGRVAFYYQKNKICAGIHIINRLDKETGGLIVFAKNGYIQYVTSKEKITKEYRCTVAGIFDNKQGEINANIKRESVNSIKRVVDKSGKQAITKYKVIGETNDTSLLSITLETGRTHQIRVHLSYIGHPLMGDALYNESATDYNDFDLTSYHISFHCPINDKEYSFTI